MMIVVVAKVSTVMGRAFVHMHVASSSSKTATASKPTAASESTATSESSISSAATASKSATSSSKVVWRRRRHGHGWKRTGPPPVVFRFVLLIPPTDVVIAVCIIVRIGVANPGSTIGISFVNFTTLLHVVSILGPTATEGTAFVLAPTARLPRHVYLLLRAVGTFAR